MGLLPADWKTELQSDSPAVFVTMEIDWPDGTERFSKAGVNSNSLGHYTQTVVKFPPLGQKLVPGQTTLTAITADVTIFDKVFAFSNRLGKGQNVQNVAARIYLNSPNTSSPFQVFGGILMSWKMTRAQTWVWHLQTPDVKLATVFPRYQINRFDFANMDKGAVGTAPSDRKTLAPTTLGSYSPIVYGKHDDYGDQGEGALPCPLIDTVGFRNLVSIGIIRVLRVYSDGVLSTTTGYSITTPIVNGRQYTLIDWAATHNTNTITADVEGYETVGDGSGFMMADPMSIIQHMLTNFVLNDYSRGLWLPVDSSFFDTTVCAATQALLANRAGGAAYASAHYISNQVSGMQALNEFCGSMQLLPYWTDAGKLGIKLDNPNLCYPNTYIDSPFIRWEQMKDLAFDYSSRQANRVIVTFENIASGGAGTSNSNTVPKEYYQLEVNDPRSLALTDEHLSTPWGPSTYP